MKEQDFGFWYFCDVNWKCGEVETMKECLLNCAFQHEGFCIGLENGFNPKNCKAKTDDDLVTEEEYVEGKKNEWNTN